MEKSILGKTGLYVSRLGAGLAQIEGQEDEKQAGRVLNVALDAGINFLDTAECYGRSEEIVGRSVGHRRDEFVLATKAGHVAAGHEGRPWTGKTVSESIDRSLARMKTDYVDLVQLHAYDVPAPPPDEVVQALMDARQAGKTRFVGYSQENEEADWAVLCGLFDTLQTSFRLCDQRARQGLFSEARAQDMGLIAKRPIANGAWAKARVPGTYGTGVPGELIYRAAAMSALGPIPGAPEDPVALSLGFVLAHSEVDTAIVGTRNPDHMLANIAIVDQQLPIANSAVEELHRRFNELVTYWPGID